MHGARKPAWRSGTPTRVRVATAPPVPGLKENWRQFSLLVLVNAFVGAMIGLERTVLPLLGEQEFGVASRSAVLSFIATFGLVKAISNAVAGQLADRVGRKRVLMAGWIVAIPVPFIMMAAHDWRWIILANVLLGANQGLAWSATVIMKIDLAGPARRGLAMGLNEFAGYLAVALSAYATGYIASRFGLRPEPFYLGVAFLALGAGISQLFIRETRAPPPPGAPSLPLSLAALFTRGQRRTRSLFTVNQAGLVNNLNDGVAWGLFPLFFASMGLGVREIGLLAFIYPATWGVAQLVTGAASDRIGRKILIGAGMFLQGAALLGIVLVDELGPWMLLNAALGLGTAMVYPTLLAAVGDVTESASLASAVGAYRFWRDLGYVVGALGAGAVADTFSLRAAIAATGVVTGASGVVVALFMRESRRPALTSGS